MASSSHQLGWTAAAASPRLRALCDVAENSQCRADLERSFDQHYVEAVLSSNPDRSLYELIEILRNSMKSHSALQELEQKMDATNFLMRVTANLWTVSGRDSDGCLILWVRAGLMATLFGSASKLKRDSPGWCAAVRAECYMFEMYYTQAIADSPYAGSTVVLDYRGQTWFDSNLALQREVLDLTNRVFPWTGECVHFFGLSRPAAAVIQVAKKMWSGRSEGWIVHADLGSVRGIVENATDIPGWFFRYNERPEPCADEARLGDYKLCVGGGTGVKRMHSNIFKPLPGDLSAAAGGLSLNGTGSEDLPPISLALEN